MTEILLDYWYEWKIALNSVGKPKPSFTDLNNFFRRLTAIYRAGVNWQTAVEIMIQEVENERLKDALLVIRSDLAEGISLADAFGAHDIFPAFCVETIRAGQDTDSMGEQLKEILRYLKKNEQVGKKLSKALNTFMFLMSFVLIALITVTYFTIPNLMEFYKEFNATLPWVTVQTITINKFVIENFYLVVVMVFIARYVIAFVNKRFPIAIGRLKFRTPTFRDFYRAETNYLFAKLMSIFIRMGKTPTRALTLTADIIENRAVYQMLDYARFQLTEGRSLAESLQNANKDKMISPTVISFVRISEETGRSDLSQMLQDISEDYSEDRDEKVEKLADRLTLAGILCSVTLAVCTFASLAIPMFSLIDQMGKMGR